MHSLKGTFSTINYLSGLIHDLLPIPDHLEDLLIIQMINSLTQTTQRSEEYDSELLHASQIRLKKNYFKVLKYALSELVHKPESGVKRSLLGKFNFKEEKERDRRNGASSYDYGEEAYEPYPDENERYSPQRESRSRTRRFDD